MIKDPELKLKYVDGESFVHHAPIFSNDSQFIYIASICRLYSYTTKTGKRFVEFKGIKVAILNYGIYHQDGTEFLIACTIDGNITCWKASNGLKVKETKSCLGPIKFFEVFENSRTFYAFVCWLKKNDEGQDILTTGLLNIFTLELKLLDITYRYSQKMNVAIGTYKSNENQHDETFVAMIAGRKMFINHIFIKDDRQVVIKVSEKSRRKFTAIATHPFEAAVLTGDNTGRVYLWYNIFAEDDYIQAVFHWHTLPVNKVCFSASGTTFFSGADECVLVKWTVDDSTLRSFLPRMSNCIQHLSIAPDNLYLAVGTLDNAIHIIDMQFKHVSIIQELVLGDEFPAGIQLDPKSRALILNGTVGHLQFYSPYSRQLLYNLDVIGMNRITNERGVRIENTNVKAVALSKSGLWMATVEERNDEDDFFECRLKFWSFNEQQQSFQLNTNVEYAHEGKVLDVKFQPLTKDDHLQLVTAGEDGFFKVWRLVDVTNVYAKGFAWRCASSGFYRDLRPATLAFSHDGSLLAVAFGDILTTWLPDTIELKCSLVHPLVSDLIISMAFGTITQSHLVVAAGKKRLCVWNLLTLSMVWSVPLQVAQLIADPLITHMGVITRNNKLFIFEPNCETPLYVHEDLVDDMRTVMAAILVPIARVSSHRKQEKWHDKSQLYIIDSNKELHCFDTPSEHDDAMLEAQLFANDNNQSAFSQLSSALRSGGEKPTQVVHNFAQKLTKSKLDDLLEGSIHTMLPMRMIAHAIINSMIHQKPKQADEGEIAEEQTYNVKRTGRTPPADCLAEDLSKIALTPATWTSVLM